MPSSCPFSSSAVLGSFVASNEGGAEEARTRGFATPAFTGCAFVEGLATLSYRVAQELSSDQRDGSIRLSSGNVRTRKQHARTGGPLLGPSAGSGFVTPEFRRS
jgi:hypothetical protein